MTNHTEAQLAEAREMLAYFQKENRALKAQRDELLAACKALVEAFTAGTSQQHIYRLAAIRAITKAEGKI